MALTPDVDLAVDEIRATFEDATVTVEETGDGGAWIAVEPVPLGAQFSQESTDVHFQVTFQYPSADVYPHFVRADLSRVDGSPLGPAFQPVQWGPHTLAGVQVSRATRQIDPTVDTAALKLLKVMEFINQS